MNNNETGYYFRIEKKTSTTHFQIVSDDVGNNIERKDKFISINSEPHIFQHIKEYNVITLGEQDVICIDSAYKYGQQLSEPNTINKVSIGVPYGKLTGGMISPSEYFNNEVKKATNKYMLNIFGNVKIADVNNNPMFTAICVQDQTYTGINTDPDNVHTLNVNGVIKAQDIKLEINGTLISLSNFFVNNQQLLQNT